MLDSETSSGRRRPTGVVLGLLVAFLVITPIAVFVLNREGGETGARSGPAVSKTTRPTDATTTTTRGPIMYTVKPGDTLTSLAKQYGVATRLIVESNQLADPDHLVEGQVLVIPPATPVRLVVKPTTAEVGGSVDLKLTGAEPTEIITFEIHRPTGVFTGPPHSAPADGKVTTTYELGLADPPGTYTVIARGDQVTTAQATFRVVEASNEQPG
jgi:LysM repeat protein